jgi:hypothetical protein
MAWWMATLVRLESALVTVILPLQGLDFVLLRQAYQQREKRCCVQSADLLFEQLQLL